MIHLHVDGDKVYNGLNIYRLTSPAWGFILRYGPRNNKNLGTKIFTIRYDRISKLFNMADIKVD